MSSSKYGVFLCHNSKDKSVVRAVAQALKFLDIQCWLDEVDTLPGTLWRPQIANVISTSNSFAIFIGEHGLGAYQVKEVEDIFQNFSNDDYSIIPILLPNVVIPSNAPGFLAQHLMDHTFVDWSLANSMARLVLGITRKQLDANQIEDAQLQYQIAYDREKLEFLPDKIGSLSQQLSKLCNEYKDAQESLKVLEQKLESIRRERRRNVTESVSRLESFLKGYEDEMFRDSKRYISREISTSLKKKLVESNHYDRLELTIESLISVIPMALVKEDNNENYNYLKYVIDLKDVSLRFFWDDDNDRNELSHLYRNLLEYLKNRVVNSYNMDNNLKAKFSQVIDRFTFYFLT